MIERLARKVKVLFYEPLGDGGIAHYTYNLIEALPKEKVSPVLVTNRNDEMAHHRLCGRTYSTMFSAVGLLVKLLPGLDEETPGPTLIRRVLKLAEYPANLIQILFHLIKERIRLVHFQTVNWIDLCLVLVVKTLNARVVYTVHNINPLHGKMKLYHRLIFRLTYRLCDRLIIHTAAGKQELMELFTLPEEKIFVIPHGDYKFFASEGTLSSSEAKAKLGISGNCRTLLFFGAIRENKGLDLALQAMSHLKSSGFPVTLIIAGEISGSYSRYEQIIRELGLASVVSEHLRYISKEDVPLFFAAADVVALPYREITQSGVLQIAYAFSKPIVAFDLPGFRESIEEGKNGYIVPLADTRAFADAVFDLFQDELKRTAYGCHSRHLADNRYSWEGIAHKTCAVYEELQLS